MPRKSKLFSKPMKRILLERAGHKCQRCSSTENLEYDHVVPIHRGGDGTLENGQILCAACHMDKTLTERRALERVA